MLHEQLLTLSKNKTDAIKKSDNDELVKQLTKERQIIQKTEQLEQVREQLVDQYFSEVQIRSEDRTITELLNSIEDNTRKQALEQSVAKLIQLIVSIRDNEQLNSELLQQSMQFVQLSLDMIQPQAKNINYGDHAKAKRTESSSKRSVFDSKV